MENRGASIETLFRLTASGRVSNGSALPLQVLHLLKTCCHVPDYCYEANEITDPIVQRNDGELDRYAPAIPSDGGNSQESSAFVTASASAHDATIAFPMAIPQSLRNDDVQ